jgi:hypothetical protein
MTSVVPILNPHTCVEQIMHPIGTSRAKVDVLCRGQALDRTPRSFIHAFREHLGRAVWRMTSQLLAVLPLVGIAGGLLWLVALWWEPIRLTIGQGGDYGTGVKTERDHPLEAEAR